jgi:lysophospholipase L1-like esterase
MISTPSINDDGDNASNTSTDNRQVFWIIGDSISFGTNNNTGPGPTTPAGTFWEWNGTSLVELTTNDLAGVQNGSPWKQFGLTYTQTRGYKVAVVNSGSPGANFYETDGNTWMSTDLKYSQGKTKLQGALNAVGVTKPRAILIILGVNDTTTTFDLPTLVQPQVQDLINRLTADYPDVPLLWAQIGRNAASDNSARLVTVRQYLKTAMRNNNNCHFAADLSHAGGAGYLGVDNLHPTQTGNNEIGKQFARWFDLYQYDNKWVRSIISCHYTELTTAQKELIKSFIDTLGENYFNLEYFFRGKITAEVDTYFDYTFNHSAKKFSTTFASNDSVSTNGTSSYWMINFNPTTAQVVMSQNDLFDGIKIKQNRSVAGGTTRVGLSRQGTPQIIIGQLNTSLVYWRVNDATTNTIVGQTKLQDNSFYSIRRVNSANKEIYQNGVLIGTAVVSSNGLPTTVTYIGSSNGSANFLDFSFEYIVSGKASLFNQLNLYNTLEALNNNW